MQEKSMYDIRTAGMENVLSTNKVLKNTYMLLGMTLLFSAVTAGVRDVKTAVERARLLLRGSGRRTFLFVDEVHRFNRAQQDAFLPHLEDGTLTLIGATTENPSFSVNSALLSRARVIELERLSTQDVEAILLAALADGERGLGTVRLDIESGVVERLAELADGDARTALNVLEMLAAPAQPDQPHRISADALAEALARRNLGLDRGREEHYNLISALHKSVRGGDPDAALYWLARLLEAGEDPMYVARRLIRIASEDVGMADPRALEQVAAAAHAVEHVGMPECELALAQSAAYLALAPKSNALYRGYGEVKREIGRRPGLAVPLQLRNAPTELMREAGYGEGYRYGHDEPGGVADLECLPEELVGTRFFRPTEQGWEARIRERLAAEYGVRAVEFCELGGRYHPSPGVTPEVVYPYAVPVTEIDHPGQHALQWVPLRVLVGHRQRLRDGHLLTLALRAAHATGQLV